MVSGIFQAEGRNAEEQARQETLNRSHHQRLQPPPTQVGGDCGWRRQEKVVGQDHGVGAPGLQTSVQKAAVHQLLTVLTRGLGRLSESQRFEENIKE